MHIVVLNDPGRLISVHLMHTGQISGWAGSMLLYESVIVEKSDTIFNPLWRQGSYVMPFCSRLGVFGSNYGWSFGSAGLKTTGPMKP